MSAIEVKSLVKKFHGQTVLHGIDLEVQKGEVVAIIGPSGSGKTTLLRSINLLEQPESGTIRVGDVTIDAGRSLGPQKGLIRQLRQHVGFVFQNFNLFPHRTVLENIISKGAAPQEVVNAIRCVASGQRYIASDIAQQMALSQIEPEKTESPFASLSERELQIMLMITKGQKVNEISEQLNLSPKTVNSYRYRMFSKLNIHGDVELTHLAIRHGLCNAESLASQ
ncbi:ATP-binding cassette domain-containing protein [Klebsiella pneumoniae]|nr:ATP-binding cassette domain-containing protein [Klebsiella pneumoniae]